MSRLDLAVEYALRNKVDGLPRMAAILFCRDGDSFVGFNSRKTHPLAKKFMKDNINGPSEAICLHAEVDAIRRCVRSGGDPIGARLYVARVLRSGRPALAKPCSGCARACVAFGIGDVIWTV